MILKLNALATLVVSLATLLEARSFGIPRSSLQAKDVERPDGQCKSFPGDQTWPSAKQWGSLNQTVKGALIGAVPIAAVCHSGARYNEAACEHLNADWTSAALQ